MDHAPLTPMGLGTLLERLDHEWSSRQRIFDLPTARFWQPDPEIDLSWWHGNLNPEDFIDLHIERGGPAVGEIMTPRIYSVDADAPVSEVASSMLDGHFHRLLVTDDGTLVGIITTSDMLKLLVEDD